MRVWLISLLAGAAFSGAARAEVETYPADLRSTPSRACRVEVDGHPVPTEKFKDIACAGFSFAGEVAVAIKAGAPIAGFTVSPRSAGVAATAVGDTLRFRLDRPRQLVIAINGGERLFLFADAIDRAAPVPGTPGVASVLGFGADPTGRRLDTALIQKAIDRVAAAGGTLYFPPGTYLTGTLALKSGLTLYLAGGAVLLGSADPADYPVDPADQDTWRRFDAQHWLTKDGKDVAAGRTMAFQRLIYINGASNVRVAGRGAIDGRGALVRRQTFRPQLVHIRNSSGVVIEGVTLRDPALFNSHILMSDRVTYRDVKILNDRAVPNSDGFDPDCSRDILADGCFFFCGDDAIAIKTSGLGDRLAGAERITVRNCVMLTTTTAMKLGSESRADWHRDITFENNDVVEADRAINLSCMDGARYENIRFLGNRVERLVFKSQQRVLVIHVRQRVAGGRTGSIHGVLIRDLVVDEDSPHPSRLEGCSDLGSVTDVRFENYSVAGRVRLSAADARVEMNRFVRDVTFRP